MKAADHRAHFAEAEPEVRQRLEGIQAEVERRVPSAERCVSYRMPAFRSGRVFFYFAAFKKHIGIYPPVEGPPALLAELEPYRGPRAISPFPIPPRSRSTSSAASPKPWRDNMAADRGRWPDLAP